MPAAVSLADLFAPEDWLPLLEVSLSGIQLLRPIYEPASTTIVDFALEYLNPAGQRMMGLVEQPGSTLLGSFPPALAEKVFQYCRRVFETGEQLSHETSYEADELGNYFTCSARRSSARLVVSFSKTSDQARDIVETALRESQAAEHTARTEAEAQRQRFHDVLMQLPAQVALNRGPDHVFELVNAPYQQLFSTRRVQGLPVRQALPELAGQQFYERLDQVYQTGEPFYSRAMPALVDFTNSGQLEQRYADVFFKALHNAHGQVDGILNFSYDVTEQVLARQQVETLNEELAAINEELRATNEEYLLANTALSESQQQVQQLNQELEARVQQRTQEALALQANLLATAQQQAAERELFYQVFEQAPAAVALLQAPEHRFEYVNPAYQQLFVGRPLVGLAYATALPEAAAQGFLTLLDRVYQTGETFFGSELPFTPAPAEGQPPRTGYFSFTFQAYREAGQVAGISIFAFDVTEQVLARQEREAQQQLLTSVFAQAPAGVWVVQGPDYVFEFVNPMMARILGRSVPQLLGQPYFEAMAELTNQGLPALFRRVWEQGETVFVAELAAELAYHAPGEVGYFTFVFQPLRDKEGQVTRISCVALDVTTQVLARQQVQRLNEELTATNEELNQSNTQLTRTNVDLDTFVYTASHDLKAPITNIESIVLALRDTLPTAVKQSEVVAHLLELLDQTVARFQFTIGQLTDISRLQLAHTGPAEPVHLAAVVENVRLDLAPAIVAAEAQLTAEVAPGLVVSFSPANLRSIIYNLLSNAIKYRAPDRPSQILVRAAQSERGVVLEVQDNGLGMSGVQQRQLFGLFQRLHTHVEGTGVGLYISKRLVENAGGTIAVRSQVDKGTTFTVTFPA